VIEDGLAADPPHIHELQRHELRYILGAKPKDNEYLYQLVDDTVAREEVVEFCLPDQDGAMVHHCFRYLNNVPLDKSSQGPPRVNFFEYWETDDDGNAKKRYGWVTDITICRDNAYKIMRAGRSRWRIANEPFNIR
jgi:hypothetical protein